MKRDNDAALWRSNMSEYIFNDRIVNWCNYFMNLLQPPFFLAMACCVKMHHPKSNFRVSSSRPLQTWNSGCDILLFDFFFFVSKNGSSLKSCHSYNRFQDFHSQKKYINKRDGDVRKMSKITHASAAHSALSIIYWRRWYAASLLRVLHFEQKHVS